MSAILWRRILREGFALQPWMTFEPSMIRKAIASVPIIVDSRPPDVVDAGPLRWDFTALALPFPEFWYEYTSVGMQANVGVAVFAGDEAQGFIEQDDYRIFKDNGADRIVFFLTFASVGGGRPTVGAEAFFALNADGAPVCNGDGDIIVLGPANEDAFRISSSTMFTPLACFFEGLEIMSCKNVGLSGRPVAKRDAEYAERRHGKRDGGYRYHVLVVRKPGSHADSPSVEVGTMPRHICRGHFSEYGPRFGKGLLFGRLAGRFYVPPHMRGSAKNGVVDKDYQIEAIA